MSKKTIKLSLGIILVCLIAGYCVFKFGFCCKKDLEHIKNYTLVQKVQGELKDSLVYVYKHDKTDASVVYYNNPSETNNVFSVVFKIVPFDDSGTFHVLEHTVMMGSKKYPFSEVLFKLYDSQIKTFANAVTNDDSNFFPVSSNNYKSFIEFSNAYMDAVFDPLVIENPTIFYEEGVRKKINEKGKLVNVGIVYNEMLDRQSKYEVIMRTMNHNLLGTGGYIYNSGGTPYGISTQLSYENLVKAYDTYYKPSNSLIYFYGNMDIKERLEYLDKNYLSKYEKTESVDLPVSSLEESVDPNNPKVLEYRYHHSDSDSKKDSVVTIGMVKDGLSFKDTLGLSVVVALIFDDVSSQYRQELLENTNLFKDISIMESGLEYKSVVDYIKVERETDSKNAREIYHYIMRYLSELVEKGISIDQIRASIQNKIFKEKQIETSNIGLDKFDYRIRTAWKNTGSPLSYLNWTEVYEELLNEDSSYFSNLIKEFILDNKRKIIGVFKPDRDYLKKIQDEVNSQLDFMFANISEEDKLKLEQIEKDIIEYNNRKVDIDQYIKPLSIEDIKDPQYQFSLDAEESNLILEKSNSSEANLELRVLNYDLLYDPVDSLGLMFGLSNLSEEEIFYFHLYLSLFNVLSTNNYSSTEWTNKVRSNGLVDYNLNFFSKQDFSVVPRFTLEVRSFELEKLDTLFNLSIEKLYEAKLDNKKIIVSALGTVLKDRKFFLDFGLDGFNLYKATMYSKSDSYILNYLQSESAILKLKEIIGSLNSQKGFEGFVSKIISVRDKVLKNNLPVVTISTSNKTHKEEIKTIVLKSKIADILDSQAKYNFDSYTKVAKDPKNMAYITSTDSTQVGSFINLTKFINSKNAIDYDFISKYLSTYLNTEIRVKKGVAYGAGIDNQYGSGLYVKVYRCNNIGFSKEIFDGLYKHMKEASKSISTSEELRAKVKYISFYDRPSTPIEHAHAAFDGKLAGRDSKKLLEQRQRVIEANLSEMLSSVADEIKQEYPASIFTVSGSKTQIEENKKLFDKTLNVEDLIK